MANTLKEFATFTSKEFGDGLEPLVFELCAKLHSIDAFKFKPFGSGVDEAVAEHGLRVISIYTNMPDGIQWQLHKSFVRGFLAARGYKS